MTEKISLSAADGHVLAAHVASPRQPPIGGLVVVQEIFGVNLHIRSVADWFAEQGFYAVAPALFDRVERDVDLGYEGADREHAVRLMRQSKIDDAVADVSAALDYARKSTGGRPSGVVGYCFGGTLAWLAATRLPTDAAVGYYGGQIKNFVSETPKVPVMLHFGRLDQHIPASDVAEIQRRHPQVRVFWYDAGHGFNCDARGAFDPQAAQLSRQRTVEFLRDSLAP